MGEERKRISVYSEERKRISVWVRRGNVPHMLRPVMQLVSLSCHLLQNQLEGGVRRLP